MQRYRVDMTCSTVLSSHFWLTIYVHTWRLLWFTQVRGIVPDPGKAQYLIITKSYSHTKAESYCNHSNELIKNNRLPFVSTASRNTLSVSFLYRHSSWMHHRQSPAYFQARLTEQSLSLEYNAALTVFHLASILHREQRKPRPWINSNFCGTEYCWLAT